jgi:hypothetical protein
MAKPSAAAAGSHPHTVDDLFTPPIFRRRPIFFLPLLSQPSSLPASPVHTAGVLATTSSTCIHSLHGLPDQEATPFLSTLAGGQGGPVASTDELRLSFKKNPTICEARGAAGSLRRHPQV